jgi:hypothetical protein
MKKFLLVTFAMFILGSALMANAAATTYVTNIPEFNGGFYADPGPFPSSRDHLLQRHSGQLLAVGPGIPLPEFANLLRVDLERCVDHRDLRHRLLAHHQSWLGQHDGRRHSEWMELHQPVLEAVS